MSQKVRHKPRTNLRVWCEFVCPVEIINETKHILKYILHLHTVVYNEDIFSNSGYKKKHVINYWETHSGSWCIGWQKDAYGDEDASKVEMKAHKQIASHCTLRCPCLMHQLTPLTVSFSSFFSCPISVLLFPLSSSPHSIRVHTV